MDRRRQDIKTDALIVAGILLTMGWYASPWQPIDTLFTQSLARLGLETTWALLFSIAGTLRAYVAIMRGKAPRWACFVANWFSALIGLWTGLLFIHGPTTPTIMACWVIGVGSLVSLFRDARQQQKMRSTYGNRAEGGT
ncbi:MAG: hypothetical protein VW362_01595 [Candidatus Nanopelagicales bacterium]